MKNAEHINASFVPIIVRSLVIYEVSTCTWFVVIYLYVAWICQIIGQYMQVYLLRIRLFHDKFNIYEKIFFQYVIF